MSYVIKHDFDQETPYYVRLVDEGTFEEIYGPAFATLFATKGEAQKWVDTYSSMGEYSRIVAAKTAIEDFEAWAASGMVRRTLRCTNTKMSRPYNGEPIDEVIDWWVYQKHHDGEIKYEHYATWPKLYSMSKYLWNIECYHNRDYTELYTTFQIYTSKTGEFSEFEQEISRVIDKVTHKDEDGFLILPIFDHYLSEYGNSVSLLIHPETKKVKVGGRHSWDEKEFTSLEDAFNYMKRERYYK